MTEHASRVLVCYATGTGCTQGVAERIGRTLARKPVRVEVRAFDSAPDPTGYDAVVAGSGAGAGSWHPVADKWMARNAAALRAKPVALFTVGMALARSADNAAEMVGYTDRLLKKTDIRPVDVGVFAGLNDPHKFDFFERLICRIASAPEGDFRDWAAIEDWTMRIAPKLLAVAHASVA